ncbi:MAG TPA: hypothetical protein DF715_11845 [Oceanicaulis sp.]|nr:hypothetical protein [Oceanicaulis sp.]
MTDGVPKAGSRFDTGIQQLEPDAAYQRLTSNIAHVHAEDLPAFLIGEKLRAYVKAQLKALNVRFGALLAVILAPAGTGVALEFGLPLLVELGYIPDPVILDPVPFTGGSLHLSTLASWAALALVTLIPASLAGLVLWRTYSRLSAALKHIVGQVSAVIAERSLGIGHERCAVTIGEAGFSLCSAGRRLTLRWHALDLPATRERVAAQNNPSTMLPSAPGPAHIPASFDEIRALIRQPEWLGFRDEVEAWANANDRLPLDMKCYRKGAERYIQTGKGRRGQLLHERVNGPAWKETVIIHRRFFESAESELSWPQFVTFALVLAQSNEVPHAGSQAQAGVHRIAPRKAPQPQKEYTPVLP